MDPKTVRRLIAARDAGTPVEGPGRRERIIDPFQPKIEEMVDTSEGLIRADKALAGRQAGDLDGLRRGGRRDRARGQ